MYSVLAPPGRWPPPGPGTRKFEMPGPGAPYNAVPW